MNHKAAVITSKGMERVAALEVKEILGIDSEMLDSAAVFDIKEPGELCKLCYLSQSASRILYLFDSFTFSSMDQITDKTKSTDFSGFLNPEKSFKIKCERRGEHDFSSAELNPELARIIEDKTGATPDFKNPDIIVYIAIFDDKCHIGADFAGDDMAKRDYRLFAHSERLKATIAYAGIRLAGYTGKEKLADPFCNNGTIIIEAGLFASRLSVNYFSKDRFAFERFPLFEDKDMEEYLEVLDKRRKNDKLPLSGYDSQVRNVSSSEKNAKAAGINKLVSFSRMDIEWLSTKFDDNELDFIVTSPPIITKYNEKKTAKIHHELFKQAETILSDKGKIVLITPTPDKIKDLMTDAFAVSEKIEVWQGKQKYFFLIFKRK